MHYLEVSAAVSRLIKICVITPPDHCDHILTVNQQTELVIAKKSLRGHKVLLNTGPIAAFSKAREIYKKRIQFLRITKLKNSPLNNLNSNFAALIK